MDPIDPERSALTGGLSWLWAGAIVAGCLALTYGGWQSRRMWEFRRFVAELEAIEDIVLSWKYGCPAGMKRGHWDDACQTVQIAVTNVVYPPAASLEEVRRFRAEVEERDKEPVIAETLEWLLMRLARTGPNGAEYIQRMQRGGKSRWTE